MCVISEMTGYLSCQVPFVLPGVLNEKHMNMAPVIVRFRCGIMQHGT